MTSELGTNTIGWLDQFAQTGSPWALISIFIVAFGVIAYVAYRAYAESKKENHEQMTMLLDRADRIQEEVRQDSKQREAAMMKELGELSCAFAGLSNGFGVFSGILERNTEDIKDVKKEVSSLKDVMIMKN